MEKRYRIVLLTILALCAIKVDRDWRWFGPHRYLTANGETNDYAYGQTAAKNLAIGNPANAVMNADNHEYFAENNPVLS